jgi:hypothetical protein
LAALSTFLCLAWAVTPRFTRAMNDLLFEKENALALFAPAFGYRRTGR